MKPPKITVMLDATSGSPALKNTIRSIEDQQYKNLEIFVLICNNDIIELFNSTRLPVPTFLFSSSVSVSAELNKVIRYSTGDYVIFLDHHSVLFADGLKILLEGFAKPDIMGVFSKSEIAIKGKSTIFPEKPPQFDSIKYLTSMPFCSKSARMFNLSVVKSIGFNPTLGCLYHYDLDLKIAKNHKVIFVDNNVSVEYLSYEIEKNLLYEKEYEIVMSQYSDELRKQKIVDLRQSQKMIENILNVKENKPETKEQFPKVLIYTGITGNYDNLSDLNLDPIKYQAVCFTNNDKLKSNTWKIICNEKLLKNKEQCARYARKIKWQVHKLYWIHDYDFVVWIDGNIKFISDIKPLIDDLKDDLLTMFKHNERNCIYKEAGAIKKLGKADEKKVDEQIAKYKKEKHPEESGLYATHFMIFKPVEQVFDFFDQVDREISEFTRRDQLPVAYLLNKTQLPFHILLNTTLESKIWNSYFKKERHNVQAGK